MCEIQKFAVAVILSKDASKINADFETVIKFYKRNSISFIELTRNRRDTINKDFFNSDIYVNVLK